MGRNKEPIKLLEIKGKTHLTKNQISEREETEVPVLADDVKAPDFLNAAEKRKFNEIADKLMQLEIMSDLDCDVLGRYIKSLGSWVIYEKLVNITLLKLKKKIESEDEKEIFKFTELLSKYETLKTKAFNQCHTCASALGMTITSRCKIVVPKIPEEKPPNKFLKLGTGE